MKENKNNLTNERKQQIENKADCKIHVMPSPITDSDITILFNGILGVIKRKTELDIRAEILSTNLNNEKLLKELKEKQHECVRLKNEIIYLKSKLKENQYNF